jgi:hypothetical protein
MLCDIYVNCLLKKEDEGRGRGVVVRWTNKRDRKGMQEKGGK